MTNTATPPPEADEPTRPGRDMCVCTLDETRGCEAPGCAIRRPIMAAAHSGWVCCACATIHTYTFNTDWRGTCSRCGAGRSKAALRAGDACLHCGQPALMHSPETCPQRPCVVCGSRVPPLARWQTTDGRLGHRTCLDPDGPTPIHRGGPIPPDRSGGPVDARDASLVRPQPPPTTGEDSREVLALVLLDLQYVLPHSASVRTFLEQRSAAGAVKYGTTLRVDNGREPVVDAVQEAGDLVMYLRQAIAQGRITLRPLYMQALAVLAQLLREAGTEG